MSFLAKSLAARPRLLVMLLLIAAVASLRIADKVISSGSPAPPATVGLVRTLAAPPIADASVSQMVRSAVDLAEGDGVGLTNIIQPGQSVLIQPNLVNADPSMSSGSGIVTDVRVVREVVAMCFEAGAGSVKIGEGTAAYASGQDGTRDQTWKAFYYAGYSTSASSRVFKYDSRVTLVDFNDAGGTQPNWSQGSTGYNSAYVTGVDVPNSLLRSRLYLPNALMRADVVIKVPVLKNHNLAGVTGALKTAVGTAPCDIYHYPNMTIYKWALLHQPENMGGYSEVQSNARTIVDLNKCRPADFTVMDGLIGITNGPGGSNKPSSQVRCMLAGRDLVAVDTVECLLEGYDPGQVPSLTLAADAGLGTNDIANIRVKCNESQLLQHVNDARVNFPDNYVAAGRRADETDPQMDGLTAGEGATVGGTITIAPLNPRDTGDNLCKGELFVDGSYVGSTAGGSYGVAWNSKSVADGVHSVKLYLYDNCLNETSAVRSIVVNNTSPIAGILSRKDSDPVQIGGLVTSIAGNDVGGWLYAQAPDRSGGVKVLVHSGIFAEGSLVDISGVMSSSGGERCIDATRITVSGTPGSPAPLGVINRSLGGGDYGQFTKGIYGAKGLYSVGLLVRTWGKVTYADTGCFYLDDGSKLDDGSTHTGVRVQLGGLSAPGVGQNVTVTGISAIQQINGRNQRVLIPRKASDIN